MYYVFKLIMLIMYVWAMCADSIPHKLDQTTDVWTIHKEEIYI